MDENKADLCAGDRRNTQHKGKSIPEVDFEQLSGNQVLVRIRLGSEVYELRKTKAGKLVLNK